MAELHPQLKNIRFSDRVIQITDSIGNACTLVTGSKKAILFDTMAGPCDLKSYVSTLTDLPLTVVCSHGHFDHISGSWQFEEVWLNPLEIPVYEQSKADMRTVLKPMNVPLPDSLKEGAPQPRFPELKEGMTFDLGGLTAEAVSLPGHTAGSMGLLLKEERMVLVGDAASPQMCLLFPESEPVEVYLKTLDKLEALPADRIVGSHFLKTFPMEAVDVFRKCTDVIGKGRPMKYTFNPVPYYKGYIWFYKINEPVTGETVAIITPRE